VVRDHGFHFCEADRLDTDASDDLLVGEGEEKFSSNGGGCAFAKTEENDGGGEEEADAVCYYEGEKDLVGLVGDCYIRVKVCEGVVIWRGSEWRAIKGNIHQHQQRQHLLVSCLG
jgi:hypothetical protein